jgi:DNA-binding NtrC family response regulator
VLIEGQTGTGKELVARLVHEHSGRRGPFVPVNCGAIPAELMETELFGHAKGAFTGAHQQREGLFVAARGGTLFLDEISEMRSDLQVKLLRALEEGRIRPVGADREVPIDVRIVASAQPGLREQVQQRRFREDLYYRLNVVSVRLPPLRERRDDIPELVEHLLARHARELGKPIHGVSHEAMRRLRAGRWKGNIRELDNVLQRAVILGEGPLVTVDDLPPDLAVVEDDPELVDNLADAVYRFERRHFERVLAAAPDKREAARRLGISLSSLYRRMTELHIPTAKPEPEPKA